MSRNELLELLFRIHAEADKLRADAWRELKDAPSWKSHDDIAALRSTHEHYKKLSIDAAAMLAKVKAGEA